MSGIETIPRERCALWAEAQGLHSRVCLARNVGAKSSDPQQHALKISRLLRKSLRQGLAVGLGRDGGVEADLGMVHAGHAPVAVGSFAHGHAAAAQAARLHIDRELILIPDGLANGMKGALMNVKPRGGSLMKIALTEIASDLFPAVQLFPGGEHDDLRIETVAKSFFVRFVEGPGAARGVVLHFGGELSGA